MADAETANDVVAGTLITDLMETPPMSIIDRIKKLNDEIAFGAELESKLRRYVKREKGSDHGRIVQEQLDQLSRRLDHAEREKADLVRQTRDAFTRRDEVPELRNRNVRFYGIEAV